MNTVSVRHLNIGTGIPKICVPLTGRTKEELLIELQTIQTLSIDLVEWRADFFEQISDFSAVFEELKELRRFLQETPLLFTFRTKEEGGQAAFERNDYIALLRFAIQSNYVDLIDIELFLGDTLVTDLTTSAHAHGVKVIVSSHDFEKTPPKEELISRLRKMQELGADLPKLAVMPQNRADVLTLLSATEEMVTHYANRPIITVSMSNLGTLSRLCGEIFGSAVTFASIRTGSAPGQVSVNEVKKFLEQFHSSSFSALQ